MNCPVLQSWWQSASNWNNNNVYFTHKDGKPLVHLSQELHTTFGNCLSFIISVCIVSTMNIIILHALKLMHHWIIVMQFINSNYATLPWYFYDIHYRIGVICNNHIDSFGLCHVITWNQKSLTKTNYFRCYTAYMLLLYLSYVYFL